MHFKCYYHSSLSRERLPSPCSQRRNILIHNVMYIFYPLLLAFASPDVLRARLAYWLQLERTEVMILPRRLLYCPLSILSMIKNVKTDNAVACGLLNIFREI